MSKNNKKKASLGGVLRNIILIAAVCVFLFSAYQLVNIYLEYKKGTDEYDKIREYVKEPEGKKEETKGRNRGSGREKRGTDRSSD